MLYFKPSNVHSHETTVRGADVPDGFVQAKEPFFCVVGDDICIKKYAEHLADNVKNYGSPLGRPMPSLDMPIHPDVKKFWKGDGWKE